MRTRCVTFLALCLSALTACEKDEPLHYPVTMRFSRIEPASDYQFYIGGKRVDDPARMQRFRDTPIRVYPAGGGTELFYWAEPDGSQFDRIDFPDRDHFRMLWAQGGEDGFDILRHDGLLVMVHPEAPEYMEEPVFRMLRWREGDIDVFHPQIGMIHKCLWGRFTSEHRFEMEWMQLRTRFASNTDTEMIYDYSNAIDLAKVDRMGPRDTMVVRHYKMIFTR